MADKLFCAHCDLEFASEEAAKKPRCPQCMRRGGVQPVVAQPEPTPKRRAGVLAAVLVAVAGLVGYGAYRANTVTLEETPPLRPLDPREVTGYLERDQLSVGRLDGLFVLTGEIDWPSDPAEVAAAVRSKSTRWNLEKPLPRDLYTAEETLAALSSGDKPQLYPLEAAVAMAALLRDEGLPAMVAETWDLGEPSPPDPTGRLGYFLVAVENDESDDPDFYDPWGGRTNPKPASVRILRDTEVIGAGLATDAVRTFVRSGDGAESLPLIETALLLDPVSPSSRSVHGTVLLETGGVTAGSKELEAARELRADGPRDLNLVQLSMATAAMLQMGGQHAAAAAELGAVAQTIDQVIERWPQYARAYRVRAMMNFGMDQPERARAALETAQTLDPSSASLWALWGQYYLAEGDLDAAVARVRRSVELDPDNWQQRLQAARVLLEAGDVDGAKAQTDAALELVPPKKRDELRRYLAEALGPGVAGGGAIGAPPAVGLELDAPSLGAPGGAPSPGGQDPALMLGDPSNLRLRDPDQDLRLDLDN
ncbi:MAG: tetratricopeptide repeat protein [Myxococcota bacterium]